jgi:hypothetical protein
MAAVLIGRSVSCIPSAVEASLFYLEIHGKEAELSQQQTSPATIEEEETGRGSFYKAGSVPREWHMAIFKDSKVQPPPPPPLPPPPPDLLLHAFLLPPTVP